MKPYLIVEWYWGRMSSSGMWRFVGGCRPAHSGSSLVDFYTLKMEAIRSAETSVNTRPTQRHIPEDDILHSHRCESLRSYMV
jgi:hypothetical protein